MFYFVVFMNSSRARPVYIKDFIFLNIN